MTRRQNLADAIRQTSLGNSSKMGELLDRFVQGKPCGTPQDIDFLIDEVVKRIETRLIKRISQLPQTSLNQPSKEEKKVSRTKKRAAGTPTVSETTLRHQARLIVEHILKIAKRHFKESSRKVSSGKKSGGVGLTPAKVNKIAERDAEKKFRVSTKKASTQPDGNRRTTGNKPAPDRRSQVYYRLANTDGESQTTANTYALRKAKKASLRRYSVSGNVKALMCAAEWATSGDMEVVAAPVGRTVAKALPNKVELLQDGFFDNHDDSDFSNFRPEVTSTKSPRSQAVKSSSKGSSKTKGTGTFLNSSYTYARRAEIKKALPKFLASRSRDAMMNVFDAIRLAMAEEEVENQDFDFLASLINSSQEKSSSPSQKARPKQRDVYVNRVAETPTALASEHQQDVHMDTSTNGGSKDLTYAAMLERDEPDARNRMDSFTKDSRSKARSKGTGTFLNSSYTYARRAEIKKALPKFLASGSRDAMMNMFDAIRLAMAEEEIENQDFDFIASFINRSQEQSSSQKARPKQRDANVHCVAETPTALACEHQQDVHMDTSTNGGSKDRTFAAMLETHEPEARMDGFKEDLRSKAISSQSTKQQDRSAIEYMGSPELQSSTNSTYGFRRDLRRMLPKYTGKKPYNALMHYADSMLVDVYQEMIRTGQFVSIPDSTPKQDTPVHRRPKHEEKVEEVNRSASYYKPIPLVVSAGQSVATQTSKNFGIDSSEDLFYDVDVWVPQIKSEQENQEIQYARIQEQKEHQAQREIDEVIYQPVQETDGDEDAFSPTAFLKENKASTSNLGLSPSKDDTDASQPRVRFADGIKPGEVGKENDETMGSPFFNKLGYYERVGGGVLLHKTAQKKTRKTDATETTKKTEESTEKDLSEPGPSTQEEIDVNLPGREEEGQTEELPSTAVEKMCNCL